MRLMGSDARNMCDSAMAFVGEMRVIDDEKVLNFCATTARAGTAKPLAHPTSASEFHREFWLSLTPDASKRDQADARRLEARTRVATMWRVSLA